MKQKSYAFVCTGINKLFMHYDNLEWADELESLRKNMRSEKQTSKAGDDRSPPETWMGSLYHDGTSVAMPTANLRSMLTTAGSKIGTGSRQATMKKMVPTGIIFLDEYAQFTEGGKQIPIAGVKKISGTYADHKKQVIALGFALDARRARIGQAKHVRVRPVFSRWKCSGTFILNDDRITDDMLDQLWHVAGTQIGLCDWRPSSPQSPGPYGTFTAKISPA